MALTRAGVGQGAGRGVPARAGGPGGGLVRCGPSVPGSPSRSTRRCPAAANRGIASVLASPPSGESRRAAPHPRDRPECGASVGVEAGERAGLRQSASPRPRRGRSDATKSSTDAERPLLPCTLDLLPIGLTRPLHVPQPHTDRGTFSKPGKWGHLFRFSGFRGRSRSHQRCPDFPGTENVLLSVPLACSPKSLSRDVHGADPRPHGAVWRPPGSSPAE